MEGEGGRRWRGVGVEGMGGGRGVEALLKDLFVFLSLLI